MIKSMTGYGKGTLEIEERQYEIEIKSVNHRYLDINIRMPRSMLYLEDLMKKTIASKVQRGKVDVFVTFKNNGTEGKNIKINKELAKAYINELRDLAEEEDLLPNMRATEITKYPDVLTVEDVGQDEKIKEELIKVLKEALDNLVEMRAEEGKKLASDIEERAKIIAKKVDEISTLSTGLIEEYVVKLEDRIKELLKTKDVDKALLAQEVVIYADKCSIEEEVTRLKSHIMQLNKLLQKEGAVGKQLDFLIQEMNRETNTIGSKANNLEITNNVISIKTRNRRHKRTSAKYRIERTDKMELINIGFGNIIVAERIVAIISPESSPIKRLVQDSRDNKTVIDATYGRKTRSVLVMDSGHIILAAVQPETVAGRLGKNIK